MSVADGGLDGEPWRMVQFAAVFQSPLVGFAFHVALPAGAIRTMERELMVSVRLRRKEE